MRIRKTREWLKSHNTSGYVDSATTRMLRLMLAMILDSKWERSHKAKIKRVHAGINRRAASLDVHKSQHNRTTVIFK